MSPDKNDNAMCPKCGQKLIYIEHYQSYYCSSCDEHFEIAAMDPQSGGQPAISNESSEPITDPDMAIRDIEESLVGPESEGSIPPPPPGFKKPPKIPKKIPTVIRSQNKHEDEYIEQEQTYGETNNEVYDDTGQYEHQVTDYEEQKEDYQDPETTEIQEEEQYISELESLDDIEGTPELTPVSSSPLDGSKQKRKRKFKKYRYRTRMIKGSILPILFGVISFQMINSSRLQFPDYYELEAMMILMGFLMGVSIISIITVVNLIKAEKNSTEGFKLNSKVGVVAYLPFIVIFLSLTLFVSLSTGWKFATGFFLASIFPFLIITLFEVSSKGKFFVKEMVDDPSWGRKLIFIR
jgi:hypothetical protein